MARKTIVAIGIGLDTIDNEPIVEFTRYDKRYGSQRLNRYECNEYADKPRRARFLSRAQRAQRRLLMKESR